MDRSSGVLGGLFGVACGDALGGTLEFMSKEEGRKEYGYLKDIIGGGVWNLEAGEVTDDTMMTIAVAQGILEDPKQPIDSIGNNFMKWYHSNPKDIGNIIATVFEEYEKLLDWDAASKSAHDINGGKSAGNGSLMRCIPAALYYRDLKKMLSITEKQSDMTHFDSKASRACKLYNTLVYRYLNNGLKLLSIRELLDEYPEYRAVFEMREEDLKPTGYVVDTLLCALWCFINTSNFEAAVCTAVNLCGDADTIGAITGGIAGVYYGYESIPERWKEKIILKDLLIEISEKIIKA